jgi:hypothetical protein
MFAITCLEPEHPWFPTQALPTKIPEACCWTLSASANATFYSNSNQLYLKTIDMQEHTRSASAADEKCMCLYISITTL